MSDAFGKLPSDITGEKLRAKLREGLEAALPVDAGRAALGKEDAR